MAKTMYKKMILLAGGVAASGTLWYNGRNYFAPAAIDYAEVAGKALEASWLTGKAATDSTYRDSLTYAMTNWLGKSALRSEWSWIAGTLPAQMVDAYNLYMAETLSAYGRHGMFWYVGLVGPSVLYNDTASLYERNTDGTVACTASWAPIYPSHATRGRWPELDYSTPSNNTPSYRSGYVVDPGTLGITNAYRELTGFGYQTNKWRTPSTNELNVLKAVAPRMKNIMWVGATPTNMTRISHYKVYTNAYRYTGTATAPTKALAESWASSAWSGLALREQGTSTNTATDGPYPAVTLDGNVTGGVLPGGAFTGAVAELTVRWTTYSGVAFGWPCAFAFQTGLVTVAHVDTMAAFGGASDPRGDVATLIGSSDDPATTAWYAGDAATLLKTPTLRTVSTYDGTGYNWHRLEIAANYLKSVGNVGTAVALAFGEPSSPSYPTAFLWTLDRSGETEPTWEWQVDKRSDFQFVILPEVTWGYLTD